MSLVYGPITYFAKLLAHNLLQALTNLHVYNGDPVLLEWYLTDFLF